MLEQHLIRLIQPTSTVGMGGEGLVSGCRHRRSSRRAYKVCLEISTRYLQRLNLKNSDKQIFKCGIFETQISNCRLGDPGKGFPRQPRVEVHVLLHADKVRLQRWIRASAWDITMEFMAFNSRRSAVLGTRGMVACTQPLAAEVRFKCQARKRCCRNSRLPAIKSWSLIWRAPRRRVLSWLEGRTKLEACTVPGDIIGRILVSPSYQYLSSLWDCAIECRLEWGSCNRVGVLLMLQLQRLQPWMLLNHAQRVGICAFPQRLNN